jgi:hypothetical protein
MERKTIVILVVLFVIVIAAIVVVYFRFEKPKQENTVSLIDLSIFAYEGENRIRTNYSIFVDGFFFGSGLTNTDGAALYKVPLNSSITIINSNLPGQVYYKNPKMFFTDKNETTRVNLDLISVGNLTVNSTRDGFKINTSVSTAGYFKDMSICIDWSIHVIFAEIANMTKIPSINNHTKCYQGNTLENEEFSFIIIYNTFGIVNENDYIDVSFYDFDETYTKRLIYKNNNI